MSDVATTNGPKVAPVLSTIIQTVTVVALFIAGFWAGIIQPLQGEITELKHTTLTLAEHNEFRLNVDRRLAASEIELFRLRDSQVPRNEHEQHWTTTAADVARLQKEIDDFKVQVGSTYTLGDQLKHIQSELDELQRFARPQG